MELRKTTSTSFNIASTIVLATSFPIIFTERPGTRKDKYERFMETENGAQNSAQVRKCWESTKQLIRKIKLSEKRSLV